MAKLKKKEKHGTKRQVWQGTRKSTKGGARLKKDDLKKNKQNKVVQVFVSGGDHGL